MWSLLSVSFSLHQRPKSNSTPQVWRLLSPSSSGEENHGSAHAISLLQTPPQLLRLFGLGPLQTSFPRCRPWRLAKAPLAMPNQSESKAKFLRVLKWILRITTKLWTCRKQPGKDLDCFSPCLQAKGQGWWLEGSHVSDNCWFKSTSCG